MKVEPWFGGGLNQPHAAAVDSPCWLSGPSSIWPGRAPPDKRAGNPCFTPVCLSKDQEVGSDCLWRYPGPGEGPASPQGIYLAVEFKSKAQYVRGEREYIEAEDVLHRNGLFILSYGILKEQPLSYIYMGQRYPTSDYSFVHDGNQPSIRMPFGFPSLLEIPHWILLILISKHHINIYTL